MDELELSERSKEDTKCHEDDSMSIHWTLNMRRKCYRFFGSSTAVLKRPSSLSYKCQSQASQVGREPANSSSIQQQQSHLNDAMRLQVPLEQQDNASLSIENGNNLWPLTSHQETTPRLHSSTSQALIAANLSPGGQENVEAALSECSGSGSMLSASSSLLSQLLNSSLNQLIEIDTGSCSEQVVVVDKRDLLFRQPVGATTTITSSAKKPRRVSRRCWLTKDSSSPASSCGDNSHQPPIASSISGLQTIHQIDTPPQPLIDCRLESPAVDNQLTQQQHDSLLEVSQNNRPPIPAHHSEPQPPASLSTTECCDFQCCPLCLDYDSNKLTETRGLVEQQLIACPNRPPPPLPPHQAPAISSHNFSSSSSCDSLGSASSCAVRVTATDSSDSDLNNRKKNRKLEVSYSVENPTNIREEAQESKFYTFTVDRKLVAPSLLSSRQLVLPSLSSDTAPLFGLDPRQLRPSSAREELTQRQVSEVNPSGEDRVSVVEARAKLARVVEWSRSGTPMSGVSVGIDVVPNSRLKQSPGLAEPIYDVPTQEALAAAGRTSLSPDQKYPAGRTISHSTHAAMHPLASAEAVLADNNNKWLPVSSVAIEHASSGGRPTPSRHHQLRLVERPQVRRCRTAGQQVGAQQPRAMRKGATAAIESGGSLSRLATQGSSELDELQVGAGSHAESLQSGASSGCCPICCSPSLNPSRRPDYVYTRHRRKNRSSIITSTSSGSCERTCCSCCSCFSSTPDSYDQHQHDNRDDDDDDDYQPSSLTKEYLRRHRSKQHSSHSRHARTHRHTRRRSTRLGRLITAQTGGYSAATCRPRRRPQRPRPRTTNSSRGRSRSHGRGHSRHSSHHRRHMGRDRGHLCRSSIELHPLINGRNTSKRRTHQEVGELLLADRSASGRSNSLPQTHSQKDRQKAASKRAPLSQRQQARLMCRQSVPAGDLESAQVGVKKATATLTRSTNYDGLSAPQVDSVAAPEVALNLHRSRNASVNSPPAQLQVDTDARGFGEPTTDSETPAAMRHAVANYLRHAEIRRHPRLRPAWINGSQGGSHSGHRRHRRNSRHHLHAGRSLTTRHRHCNHMSSDEFTCHDNCLRTRHSCAASHWSRRRRPRRHSRNHLSLTDPGKLSAHRKLGQRAIEQLESDGRFGHSPAVHFHTQSDAQQFEHQQRHQQQAAEYLVRAQRILNEERRRKRSNLLKRYPLAGFGGCFGKRVSSEGSISVSSARMNRATINCSSRNNLRSGGGGGGHRADKFQSRATLNLMRSMQRALIASSNYTDSQHETTANLRRQFKSNLTQNTSNPEPQIDQRLMDKFLVKTLASVDQKKISSYNKRCQCNHCSLVNGLIRQDLETRIRKRILAHKLAGKQYSKHRHRKPPLIRY